jgi:predicted dehydrogenase
MISKISNAKIDNKIIKEDIKPSFPQYENKWRKAVFFLCNEGFVLTLKKIFSVLRKANYETKITGAKINEIYDAVSYDGGKNYYVTDIVTDHKNWNNPFSYDFYNPIIVNNKYDRQLSVRTNNLFLYGSGSYARTYVDSSFKNSQLYCCVDYNDLILKSLKHKFKFRLNHVNETIDLWNKAIKPIGLICTFHSDHANIAYQLHQKNPNGFIFIEKPPVVTWKDIALIKELYNKGCKLEIGFNRRYTKFISKVKTLLGNSPKLITISVNELKITEDHWYYWQNQGTRITGNLCHWIDLCQYLINAKPIHITLLSSSKDEEDMILNIAYEDGSLASIIITDKGNNLRGVQELIEIKENGMTILIEDFIKMIIFFRNGRQQLYKSLYRDKGHNEMYKSFVKNVRSNSFKTKYQFNDFIATSFITLKTVEMLKNGLKTSDIRNFYKEL